MDNHTNWLVKQQKTAIELWNDQGFFRIEELVPKDVFIERGEKAIELFSARAIFTIIETRILFNASITINNWPWEGEFQYRGWRPWSFYFNSLIKKNKPTSLGMLLKLASDYTAYSQHSFANAFDYDVKGLTAEQARPKLIGWKKEGKLKFLTGIEKDVNWVHNDYRISQRLDDNGLFLF